MTRRPDRPPHGPRICVSRPGAPVLGGLCRSCWARTPAGTSAIITGTRLTPSSTTAWRIDVAVAHQASYYNPYLDIPFYWLATHTHAWIALGVLGAVQGANMVPLYLIARARACGMRRPQDHGAGALALLGQVGRADPHRIRHHLLRQCDERVGAVGAGHPGPEPRRAARRAARADGRAGRRLAGFLTGMAMGLKLPEMPFCVGFAAALVALGGSLEASGGAAGRPAASAASLGFALFSGPWMLHM